MKTDLDRVPLWSGDHVAVRQLVEFFASYLYLPRLAGPEVLVRAICDGVALLTWQSDTFGFAESYDEAAGRYRGLRAGQVASISTDGPGLVVKAAAARKQLDAEVAEQIPAGMPGGPTGGGDPAGVPSQPQPGAPGPLPGPPAAAALRRFHGTVSLDPARVGRDAGKIADEVISHLVGLVGSKVRVTLEIEAVVDPGVPEKVVRTVTENSRTLKFSSQEFEVE